MRITNQMLADVWLAIFQQTNSESISEGAVDKFKRWAVKQSDYDNMAEDVQQKTIKQEMKK